MKEIANHILIGTLAASLLIPLNRNAPLGPNTLTAPEPLYTYFTVRHNPLDSKSTLRINVPEERPGETHLISDSGSQLVGEIGNHQSFVETAYPTNETYTIIDQRTGATLSIKELDGLSEEEIRKENQNQFTKGNADYEVIN